MVAINTIGGRGANEIVKKFDSMPTRATGRGERLRAQYADVRTTEAVMSDDDWNYLKTGCSKLSKDAAKEPSSDEH